MKKHLKNIGKLLLEVVFTIIGIPIFILVFNESISVLKKFYQYLINHSQERFEIGGHTDSDGTPEHNKVLSQQRADAVKAQLISMGIPAERLEAKGYGSTQPIDPKNTHDAKAINRRVEFTKL